LEPATLLAPLTPLEVVLPPDPAVADFAPALPVGAPALAPALAGAPAMLWLPPVTGASLPQAPNMSKVAQHIRERSNRRVNFMERPFASRAEDHVPGATPFELRRRGESSAALSKLTIP